MRTGAGIKRQLNYFTFVILLIIAGQNHNLYSSDSNDDKTARAYFIEDSEIEIDGILDEEIWNKAGVVTDFLQKDPVEGGKTEFPIKVMFAYDENNFFIAVDIKRDKKENIRYTTSRRDKSGNSERIIISLDTYNDKRTAYTFGLTASAVRFDYYHSQDSEYSRDYSFNPVWYGKTNITDNGWTAEMKIPFSQLRFNDTKIQTWGLNMNWYVPAYKEDNYWIVIPKSETGWSSRMGQLIGIKGIKPSSRMELMPYVAGSAVVNPNIDRNDPFAEETALNGRAGIDFKMGLGPNITLDATINPDFGQVEADPAEVNLSAYETFFSEKRPFFTEGAQLLSGGGPGYFYSRRIGAPPKGSPEADYIDRPDNSQILGAAKITGRTFSGLSIGALTSLTSEEYAELYHSIDKKTEEKRVEPLASYNVLRLQQEFGRDASTLGITLTGVHRDMTEGSYLDEILRRNAYTGGLDWNIRFDNGAYNIVGFAGFSHVKGSKNSILNTQLSPAHYFQRPDANHVTVDSNRTSLSGYAASLEVNKNAGDHWLGSAGFWVESPEFELNDIGQLQSADDINYWTNIQYRETVPGMIFYSWNARLHTDNKMNFGGVNLTNTITLLSNFTFLSRNSFYLNGWHRFQGKDDALTRGGPIIGLAAATGVDFGFSTDYSQNHVYGFDSYYNWDESGKEVLYLSGDITVRMAGRLDVTISPAYIYETNPRQYINTLDNGSESTFGKRYIFSFTELNTLRLPVRINYAFTPDLTVELYAEPFATSGNYFRFWELPSAGSVVRREYGTDGTTIVRNDDRSYTVQDGEKEFTLRYRDFEYISLRSNFVLRWEWLPGSTLYLVWQQNRSDYYNETRTSAPASLLESFAAQGYNSFALKISYWFPVN